MADVICPSCAGRFHETTDKYRPGVVTTGDMLSLKKFYRENGWDSFPEQEHIQFSSIDCPGCGSAYSDNGRVRIDKEQYDKEPKPVVPVIETAEQEAERLFAEYEPELPSVVIKVIERKVLADGNRKAHLFKPGRRKK